MTTLAYVAIIVSCLSALAIVASAVANSIGTYILYKKLGKFSDDVSSLATTINLLPKLVDGQTAVCRNLVNAIEQVKDVVSNLDKSLFKDGKDSGFMPYDEAGAARAFDIHTYMRATGMDEETAAAAVPDGVR